MQVPPPKKTRAVRLGGGLSLRFDARGVVLTLVIGLVALAVAVLLVLVGSGDFPMSPGDVVQTLLGNGAVSQEFVVLDLRLPRVLTALLVGAALGLSGAVFQSISRNPLGSPDMLGFGQGAMVGALLVIVLFHGDSWAIAAGALVGCLVTGVLVYLLAWKRGVHGYRLVLVGIGASAMLTAVMQYLLTKANLMDATEAMLWITGTLDGRGWEQVWPMAAACAVLVPLVLRHGRSLRMMEMGDDAAYALGVPVERARVVLILAAVLLMGSATAAAGPITFVALSAPQVARRLTRAPGPNLVASALMGAALLIAADWVAQSAFGERQLPVGVVTGVVGGCYLLWLLVTERRAGRL
ncbi:iron chelate uptake ABC transporter family permease subunit [Streptomyces sp. NBC_00237]|uniref:FecCD family ABC transporter permease n=1 Tax=Streptomyces sp. NBC_00237 TaxID=2975687 RepID=UPI002251BE0D|nr:iron chelate uptake ABC transporter family permease subunit [Streptomyces sp. NBC_00237]MCX5202119.1 iron chelate uptake ABC transporter family permease subunit [Streptomyces sp. NBC_00237]